MKINSFPLIRIKLAHQQLWLMGKDTLLKTYPVSTGKNGVGEQMGSEKTPRGAHKVHAKIGDDCPVNTVFVERKPTGEIYSPELAKAHPHRDWILTRILQLTGLEPGKNLGGEVDTLRRCIYIHGCPDSTTMQIPGSRGCIRMLNHDIIELFSIISIGTIVHIEE